MVVGIFFRVMLCLLIRLVELGSICIVVMLLVSVVVNLGFCG